VRVTYPPNDDTAFASGNYIIAVTREGVDEGTTSGDYELTISVPPPPEE